MKRLSISKLYLSESISKTTVGLVALVALCSLNPWFVWDKEYIKLIFLGAFFILRIFCIRKNISHRLLFPIQMNILLYGYLWFYHSENLNEAFTLIFTRFLPLLGVILMTDKEKGMFVKFLVNIYSVILLVSLIYYVLWFCDVDLPNIAMSNSNPTYRGFTNYYAFIIMDNLGMFTRFQSIFTEPGHLGMISSFLLFVGCYNMKKWQNVILFIAIIWSFSLAAYVLLFLGWTLYKLATSNALLKTSIKLGLCTVIMLFSGLYIKYSYSNSILSTFIIERLQYNKKNGIEGNNRNDATFDRFYTSYKKTNEYISGIGLKRYAAKFDGTPNASYKGFVVQYGIIGLVVLCVFYLCFVLSYPSKLLFAFFLLYLFSFLQRASALWEIQSFLYICSASVFFHYDRDYSAIVKHSD